MFYVCVENMAVSLYDGEEEHPEAVGSCVDLTAALALYERVSAATRESQLVLKAAEDARLQMVHGDGYGLYCWARAQEKKAALDARRDRWRRMSADDQERYAHPG